jgi:hypothetical protein
MIRKIYLSLASLALAANITVGGMMALSSVTIPVAGVSVGTATISAGALALLMAEVACSPSQLISAGEDILSVVTDQTLINALKVLSPPALARLESLVPAAKDLIAALKAGNTTNALQLVNTIFPVIEEVVSLAVGLNPIAMAVLSLANIALHFIINHTQSSVPKAARVSPAVRMALANGAKPIWGCQSDAKNKRKQYLALCTQ